MSTIRGKFTAVFFCAGLLMSAVTLAVWYAAGQSLTGLVIGVATGVLLMTVVIYLLNASFEKTLTEHLEWSAGMAQGSFNYEFKHERNEADMVELFDKVKKMNKGVGKYTVDIQKQAVVLAEAAKKILSSTEQISIGSQDQAHQVQNILRSIEELAGAADQSAQKAEQAAEGARNSMNTATIGAEAIGKIDGGMDLIEKRIEELRLLSNKIGNIVEVIDSIAGQTNLLSLNAAIEAARAGEHGRGFAVVAGEVRKLAETSGKAAKEIKDLITGIGDATGAATGAVKQGVLLTDEAGRQFKEITALIQSTLDVMLRISGESRLEAEATRSMVGIAESIAAVTEEAAAGTEETAASVQELATIADRLKQDAELVKKSFQSSI